MAEIRPMREDEAARVVALWSEQCVTIGAPLREVDARQILANLKHATFHTDAYCFVAVENEVVIGYVTCSLVDHPIMPGCAGEIEEWWVQPHPRRRAIMTELVQYAVRTLQQHGVRTIRVLTGTDKDAAEERAFWRQLGWCNDMTVFSIYADVPGDPALQRVWDAYAE